MAMTTPLDDQGGPVRPEETPAEALHSAASLLRALGDPSRLAIVTHLELGEHRVVDLTCHLGLAQSTVSKHLACLLECGLVTVRPEGRASMYALAHPDTTRAVLAAVDHLLVLTDDAVTDCPTADPTRASNTPAPPSTGTSSTPGTEDTP